MATDHGTLAQLLYPVIDAALIKDLALLVHHHSRGNHRHAQNAGQLVVPVQKKWKSSLEFILQPLDI